MSLQKESEWELKLQEKIKENKFVTPSSHLDAEEIKYFIRETLVNREKEIADEVGKMKLNVPHIECNTGECEPCDNCVAFQMANDRIDKALKIINPQE